MGDGPILIPPTDPIKDFLAQNYGKLLEWFSSDFWGRVSNINSIPSILPAAMNFANKAAQQAQSNAINSANNFTNNKVAGLANTLNSIASSLQGQLNNGLAILGNQLQNARNEALQNDQNILQQALGTAQNLFSTATNFTNQTVSNLEQTIQAQIDFLSPIKDTLIDLAIILPEDARNQLGEFLGETANKVTDFIKCPLCPIVNWLIENLLNLLADLLADALGSVEVDLGESEDFTEGLGE